MARFLRATFLAALALLLVGWAPLTVAAAATDPLLDEHVNRLTAELRCLVCQNQTIADSQAELAMQLKREVRQQLAGGATDEQVRDFMVQRYGDFVLYRPPVNKATFLLWAAPALLLLMGAGLLFAHWRERRVAFQGQVDSELPSMELDDAENDASQHPRRKLQT
ncbi:cytochrome c-type biogenesis protein [Aquabacterium sp.]|uniref:cytochrome c-type biogenesis protein n=1 Tax=Aquabacterium sp. TaxID=1872578 RepID=UPI003D6C8466